MRIPSTNKDRDENCMTPYREEFKKTTSKKLQEKLGIKNPMAVPQLKKIVINSSTKEFLQDKKNLEQTKEDLMVITGQKPKVVSAKVSVATFKLREGDKIGLVTTLRGDRMYDFFEKLVKIVLPRVRDFSGVNGKSFDGHGNLSIGFSEHIVFPEIDSGKIDRVRSLQIIVVTSAKNDTQARALFEELGMPFRKGEKSS